MERNLPDQRIAVHRRLGAAEWLARAVIAAAFAFAVILGSQAMAADDEDDETFEEKFMKSLLGQDRPVIDYRERSPLVVPPTSTLPSPEAQQAAANPAWPKDADIRVKKKNRADPYKVNRYTDYSGRPLLPHEVDGRPAPGERNAPTSRQNEDSALGRPLRPDELGQKGNVFSSIFSSKDRTESAVFLGEPTRGSLTEPPPGYLTPSPNYPYGLSPSKEAPRPLSTPETRAVGRD
jgi:hypothetical protein